MTLEEAYSLAIKLDKVVGRLRNGGYFGGTGSFLGFQFEADVRSLLPADDCPHCGPHCDLLPRKGEKT